jgi:N-acetylglucosamine-6-phosphate deacetylase
VSKNQTLAIETHRLFDGERLNGPRRIEIVDGRIAALRNAGRSLETDSVVRLPPDAILAPGFIDIQVNGGGDALLNDDPSLACIGTIARSHRRFGTTGLLPTLITDHPDKLKQLAAIAGEAMAIPGVLGFHLEGPHLNPARKGIHPSQFVRPMTEEDRVQLLAFAARGRSIVTLAPELVPAEVIAGLARSGLRVCAGHTDAAAGQIAAAADKGLAGVTHLFNAMSQMTAREPGVVGAAMADERLFAGIIPDGICVSPMNLKTAYRAIGRDRLIIVTDAMPTAAGVRSFFRLQGRKITLEDGRLTDEHGTLAGAHLTMNEAVRNAVAMMGASLEDALIMASRTPAAFLGLGAELGRIAPGYRADFVAFDDHFAVRNTWIAGTADQPIG